MFSSASILDLHDRANRHWHDATPLPQPSAPLAILILAQHRENFDLWHEEDRARDSSANDALIAQVKHSIDTINQRRNDLVEQIDQLLLTLAGDQPPAAPLNSETPGLIVDRLSILALKLFHTADEAHRASATPAHRQRNLDRLAILRQQRADLAQCLDELWQQVLAGERRFRLYRQLKMYNDPDLNPILYNAPKP